MALTFAGVPLCVLPADYKAFIEEYHTFDDFLEVDLWGFTATRIDHLPLPVVPPADPPDTGCLTWPTGMSRCAYGHYLVSGAGLSAIEAALDGSDTVQDLVLSDGSGPDVTLPMYFLCARPLSQIENQSQAYLLTLVDQRYFLRTITAPLPLQSTWVDLFDAMATALGVTLTPDTVNSAYGVPSNRWVVYEKPIAVLLDALCNALGHRLVANLDGTFSTQQYATAEAAADAQFADYVPTAGGLFNPQDLLLPVPEEIRVNFPDISSGDVSVVPYTVTETLTSLALPAYGTQTGVAGQSFPVTGELLYTGSNAAACAAYAVRAATDWYAWQLADPDVTYPGVIPWVPTGIEDRIEWVYEIDKILTRVNRGPFQVLPRGGWEGQAPLASVDSQEVFVAEATTTGSLPSNTYANGSSGTGATLTGAAHGALPAQDAVTLTLGQVLLVRNEAAPANNGPYNLTQVGSSSTPYILTRVSGADTPDGLLGALVQVIEGATQFSTLWTCSAPPPITVGTTALPWFKLAAMTVTDGVNTVLGVTSTTFLGAGSTTVAVSGATPNAVVTVSSTGGGGGSLSSASAGLLSSYVCTTSYANTGLSITIPAAGTYLVTYTLTALLSTVGAAQPVSIFSRLVNAASTVITGFTATVIAQGVFTTFDASQTATVTGPPITFSAPDTLTVQAEYAATMGGTIAATILALGSSQGDSTMSYVKIA